MPSGDAQRAWFPEMLAELQEYWTPEISWEALIVFCTRMTAFRSEIRKAKGIRSPMMYCHSCNEKHPANLPEISPRSALFALQKLGMISDAEMKMMDRDWTRYRRENQLDAYGHPKATQPSASTGCASDESTATTPTAQFPETQNRS
jgi:hypothetical protein